MSPERDAKGKKDRQSGQHKDRAAEIANTFEWLITAFILAFVFRAFVMEAFRIPTGSMADTLKGAHFRLRCRRCGYAYDHGFIPRDYGLPDDTIPSGNARPPATQCPSCGYYHDSNPPGYVRAEKMPVANGDRILVLKCLYQFAKPKRWDVIVFKNPPEPSINYIKRLIGLPGEQVQIIDGDIYIDGKIARKPPKIQNELWMPVYDNNYQPVRPLRPFFSKNGRWEQPFRNVEDGSAWITKDPENPTLFRLDPPEGRINRVNTLFYDTTKGNDFSATYAYDQIDLHGNMPTCSDLMVRFSCLAESPQASIGIALSKYETTYRAQVLFSTGTMIVTKQEKGENPVELIGVSIKHPRMNEQTLVRFANVDHRLIFEYGATKWTHDLGRGLADAGEILQNVEPRVEIFGSGKLTLSDVAVFRDIHYTERQYGNSGAPGRATTEPFVLGDDEFFVLGDNSPNSEDCRWWHIPGVANKGLDEYPIGVVPRNYLVGKALFVYWPSGFKPFKQSPIAVIPNVGRMRFIYGGSNGDE
ncbi:MAG: signal peptidase I [Phycisphaerales bacterium]|nr:MAG: signal peptidase I [Phycisphaerales bacterium]